MFNFSQGVFLEKLRVFPPHARLLKPEQPKFISGKGYCHNGCPVTFDFRSDYSEDVIVHHQCGGGRQHLVKSSV